MVSTNDKLFIIIGSWPKLKLENPENTPKVYAALVRKGFSYGAVRDALKKYRDEFDNWKQNEGKNDIVTKGHIYLDMARNSGLFIQEFAKNYDNIRKSKSL